MARNDVISRFRWRDRDGIVWTVRFSDIHVGFSGFMVSSQRSGTGLVYVLTHSTYCQKQSMARLSDVRIDASVENRGLGSMLVREAIKECKRRGHAGIDGYLSSVDWDHFPKLKHFYKKLGFSVGFYPEDHPDYRFDRVGKIEMLFDTTKEDSRMRGSGV